MYLICSGEMLESGALYCIKKEDISSFERYLVQLKAFYNECKGIIPTSERQYPIIGLYLLFLIYQNRSVHIYHLNINYPISLI